MLNHPGHSYPTFSPFLLVHPTLWAPVVRKPREENKPKGSTIYKTLFHQMVWQEPGPPGAHHRVKNGNQVTGSKE